MPKIKNQKTMLIQMTFNATDTQSFDLRIPFECHRMNIKSINIYDADLINSERALMLTSTLPDQRVLFSWATPEDPTHGINFFPDISFKFPNGTYLQGLYDFSIRYITNTTVGNLATMDTDIMMMVEFIEYES